MVITPLPPSKLCAVVFELGVEKAMVVTTPAGRVTACVPLAVLTLTVASVQVGVASDSVYVLTVTDACVVPAQSVDTPVVERALAI